MANLSRDIELYLKKLLAEQEAGMLEIQRSLLSELFSCVPSQINYVLQTRFTPQDGYIVETRRGGGGYVRIVSVPLEHREALAHLLATIGEDISERNEERLIDRLTEEGLIDPQLATLFKALFKERVMKGPDRQTPGGLRAHLLTHLLTNLSIIPEKY